MDRRLVSVTLKNPSPTIINSFDTVCGNTVNLNVLNSQFAGIWKAYAWNETENNWEITSLYFEPNNYSPTAEVQLQAITKVCLET